MKLLKNLFSVTVLICCCTALHAQNRMLSGKIISSKDGTALPGATIYVKQNSKTFSASNDGSFSVTVPQGKILLTITSVGYSNKDIVVAENENNILIKMDVDDKQLNEVVVVGYSEKKRNELTSAVSVVSADKLKDVTSNNVGSMLQGKVAGLQVINSSGVPGATPEIRLRGISSVNASQDPLFVIDGMVVRARRS